MALSLNCYIINNFLNYKINIMLEYMNISGLIMKNYRI